MCGAGGVRGARRGCGLGGCRAADIGPVALRRWGAAPGPGHWGPQTQHWDQFYRVLVAAAVQVKGMYGNLYSMNTLDDGKTVAQKCCACILVRW